MTELTSSTPTLSSFRPVIPYQRKVLNDLRGKARFDYSLGTHEILLSGSVGSAKSTLIAHAAVTHCMQNPGARFGLFRLALPDLKATIYQKILEHIDGDLIQGIDYDSWDPVARITFRNKSEIVSRSFKDKRYTKVRSLDLSAAAVEELTEFDGDHWKAYQEIKYRVGRLPHVREKFIINATNPDAPTHPAYKHFFGDPSPTRHVYYSRTEDNPFLGKEYIEQLKRDLDPRLARRMLYGEWIELDRERIYHSYQSEQNFLPGKTYVINPAYPIAVCFDFNIGEKKPMSACAYQYIGGVFHVFAEWVVEGARTEDICEEIFLSGICGKGATLLIHGDATGTHRDTRSIGSDYTIIEKFFANRGVRYERQVPRENPPIRTRHNRVNAHCKNELGQVRLLVYGACKTVDEGMRLTALKKGGTYIEDDSKPYQHVTTALGYGIVYDTNLTGVTATSQRRG